MGKGGAVSVSVEEPKEAKFSLIFIFGYLGIWALGDFGFPLKDYPFFSFG